MKLCSQPFILHTPSKNRKYSPRSHEKCACLLKGLTEYMECAVRIFIERAPAKALKTLIFKAYLGLKTLITGVNKIKLVLSRSL